MIGFVRGAAMSIAAREGRRRCCCGPRCAACATSIDPEAPGGAYLLGLRRLGVVPHGSLRRARASRRRSSGPRAACARTSSGARTLRWRPRARCGVRRRPTRV